VIPSPLPVAPSPPPPPSIIADGPETLVWILLALSFASGFALLRASMLYSRTARIASLAGTEAARERIEKLLDKVEVLSISAGVLKVTCDLVFLAFLLSALAGGDVIGGRSLILGIVIAAPVLLLVTETLPHALAERHGDQILLRILPIFHRLQLPLQFGVAGLAMAGKAIRRMAGVPEDTSETREIVEGFREVIEDSARRGDLDETERELIENVMEFSDVDVAEIMTPRTEIHGVDIEDGLEAVIRLAAEEGHSRIPVFEENLDKILGYASARGIVQLLSEERLENASLRDHLRPTYFVPETKLVSQLLTEFRRDHCKMAIVLDEYGGTAGMITLGDILGEIVGDIGDEFDVPDPEPVLAISPGVTRVDAGLRIAEVNEALNLELPEEEDFETLGGFVLSELGHLPRPKESFTHDGVFYQVTEASDRRVISVQVEQRK
jgi:putative hemolysin